MIQPDSLKIFQLGKSHLVVTAAPSQNLYIDMSLYKILKELRIHIQSLNKIKA